MEHNIIFVILISVLCSCGFAARDKVIRYSYEVVATYPHDGNSFTQGLQCDPAAPGCSILYESTGLHGKSMMKRVETESGKAITETQLPKQLFGEGATLHKGALYQTTWRERVIRKYDPTTLDFLASQSYTVAKEGWGLTSDGDNLISSSGSSTLVFFTIDDNTMQQHVKRLVDVRLNGKKLERLNELEYVNGHVWANVWYSDTIYEIDPENGIVVGEVDLSALHSVVKSGAGQQDVLNGIAYDMAANEFLVTGKNWNAVHRIRLTHSKKHDASEL